MMQRRRELMAQAQAPAPSEDLYLIGTDVVEKYIREEGTGFQSGYTFDQTTGELITGSDYASADYIEFRQGYELTKNGTRMQWCCWYDASKTFLSAFREYNTTVKALEPPDGARYLRVSTNSGGAGTGSTSLKITRTA